MFFDQRFQSQMNCSGVGACQARGHENLVADRRAMRTSVPSAPKATRILRIDPLHESGQVSLNASVFQ